MHLGQLVMCFTFHLHVSMFSNLVNVFQCVNGFGLHWKVIILFLVLSILGIGPQYVFVVELFEFIIYLLLVNLIEVLKYCGGYKWKIISVAIVGIYE